MCSTDIRKKIAEETDWQDMVPPAVYRYIIDNGLTEKVKQVMPKKAEV